MKYYFKHESKLNGKVDFDWLEDAVDYKGEDFAEHFSRLDLGPITSEATVVKEKGKYWTVVTYEVDRNLTAEEQEVLALYTWGQMSDGIGECFEQVDLARNRGDACVWYNMWVPKGHNEYGEVD